LKIVEGRLKFSKIRVTHALIAAMESATLTAENLVNHVKTVMFAGREVDISPPTIVQILDL
jgi:hypothetical protein